MTGVAQEVPLSTETVYQTAKRAHIDAVCGSQPFKASGDYAIAEASWYLMQCEFHLAADNMLRAWKANKVPVALDNHLALVQAGSDRALLNLCMVLTGGTANPKTIQTQIERIRQKVGRRDDNTVPDIDPVTRADSLAYNGDGVVGE